MQKALLEPTKYSHVLFIGNKWVRHAAAENPNVAGAGPPPRWRLPNTPRSRVPGLTPDTHCKGEERTFLESDLTRQEKGRLPAFHIGVRLERATATS